MDEMTARQFANINAVQPRVYIVRYSQEADDRITAECKFIFAASLRRSLAPGFLDD